MWFWDEMQSFDVRLPPAVGIFSNKGFCSISLESEVARRDRSKSLGFNENTMNVMMTVFSMYVIPVHCVECEHFNTGFIAFFGRLLA